MALRIHCINKDNGDHEDPHLAISYLGWVDQSDYSRGKWSRLTMVEFIEKGGRAYVEVNGKTAYLVVRTSKYGNKYVKTVADGVETNNLLYLPECN